MRKIVSIMMLGITVAVIAGTNSFIVWKTKTIDLGEVSLGVKNTLAFEFVNQSDESATILRATGSCGCTNVKFPKGEIAPGSIARIEADFTSQKLGMFQKSIEVRFANTTEVSNLYFKGEVVK